MTARTSKLTALLCRVFVRGLGRGLFWLRFASRQDGKDVLHLNIAFLDSQLVKVVERHGLLERKDMLGLVVSDQRGADRLLARLAPDVSHAGKDFRIPLSFDDRSDDPHTRRSRHIGDDVMKLQVHERQRLLHVLDMSGGIIEMPGSVSNFVCEAR